jgi:hypothetical protein
VSLGVGPAAIFPGASPKAFAAEKVIRLRKAGSLAIMAALNNVLRHSCQIQTRSPWHRGGRNASALSPHSTRSCLKSYTDPIDAF